MIDLLLEVMREELAKPDREIRLRQFGVFSVVEARMPGGELRAGNMERQIVSAGNTYRRVRFRPSRTLLKKVKTKE